jgi:hypothetical protein
MITSFTTISPTFVRHLGASLLASIANNSCLLPKISRLSSGSNTHNSDLLARLAFGLFPVALLGGPALRRYWTALAILSRASLVPFMISFLIIPLNKSGISDSLMSHATSIRVLLSPAGLNMMTRVPITDASVSDTSTNFLEHSPTAWATFRSLKPTVTSLSVALPSFLALLTVRFCQYRGSLSTSEMMFHTVPKDAEISLAFISYMAYTPPKGRVTSTSPSQARAICLCRATLHARVRSSSRTWIHQSNPVAGLLKCKALCRLPQKRERPLQVLPLRVQLTIRFLDSSCSHHLTPLPRYALTGGLYR